MDAQADDRKKLKQIKQLLTEVTTEEGKCKNELRITPKILYFLYSFCETI